MKITNKFNLPSALVNLANADIRIPEEKHYSVTTILNGVREILLTREHFNEIETDVSDMVAMLFGTAVHYVIEQADKTGMVEQRLKAEVIDGYFLTGQFDLLNTETHTIEDYKTASVWKVIYKDFSDWRKQGLMYAWLCREKGIIVKKLRFHAILKDWTKAKSQYDKNYPKHPIFTWEYDILTVDYLEITRFIFSKFQSLIHYEKKSTKPVCTPKERWNTGDKFALMVRGKKRAVKLYDSMEEAEENVSAGMYIDVRKGVDKKCDNYCNVSKYCSYYQRKMKGIKGI